MHGTTNIKLPTFSFQYPSAINRVSKLKKVWLQTFLREIPCSNLNSEHRLSCLTFSIYLLNPFWKIQGYYFETGDEPFLSHSFKFSLH